MTHQTFTRKELKKVARFFQNRLSKYIFLVIDDERLLPSLIGTIQMDLKKKELYIFNLELTLTQASIYHQISDFVIGAQKDDRLLGGLIITGVNLLAYTYPREGIDLLNKSRDAFANFPFPIAFVVNTPIIKQIIRGASDFYQMRDLPDFHFGGTGPADPGSRLPNILFQDHIHQRENLSNINIKADLLEKQVKMTGVPQEVTTETLNALVVPLLHVYILQKDFQKMNDLFDAYIKGRENQVQEQSVLESFYKKTERDSERVQAILSREIQHRLDCIQAAQWERAIEYTFDISEYWLTSGSLQSALALLEEIDPDKLEKRHRAEVFHRIGIVLQHLGRYDEALSFFFQSLHLNEEIGNRRGKAYNWHHIGYIYQSKGKTDMALNLYEKSLAIEQDIQDNEAATAALNQMDFLQHL